MHQHGGTGLSPANRTDQEVCPTVNLRAQPWCNVLRVLRIVLHLVARRRIGWGGIVRWHVPFDVIETGQASVVLFDDGRIEELIVVGIGGGFRHGPAGLGQLGALQNEHGSAQQDGGRRLGVVEDGKEGFQGAVAEFVEVVAAGEDEFGAGAVEGGGEGLAGFHPAVDGDAMDAVSFGGIGEGGAGGQGVDDALLDRGEGRCFGGVFHSDVRVAWASARGRGFWGRFALFSGGCGGMPVCDRNRPKADSDT